MFSSSFSNMTSERNVVFRWTLGLSVGLCGVFCSPLLSGLMFQGGIVTSFLILDYVCFFLSSVSLLLLLSLYNWWGSMSIFCRQMILLSVVMSLVCYSSCNVMVFWISYELSILPLLALLVMESSYSERFIAFWYLLGYVVLTSLPLLLSIIYLYGSSGGLGFNSLDVSVLSVLSVVCVCFITKIPLPPFHVWLPIVHAEASSPVSVCLSGFIMKLGLLGVFRFASMILPHYVFSYSYLSFVFCLSAGFLLLSSQELDGKRWLAILSLSHIILSALGLMVTTFPYHWIPFVYCLGHGFSAGLVFIYLWLMYSAVGSRNWNVLKYGGGSCLFFRVLVALSLCSVASLPPTLSFFTEVRMVSDSAFFSSFFLLVFLAYLFLSGLVPLFVLGGSLSRHFSVCSSMTVERVGLFSVVFLIYCCFAFFLIM